MSFNKKEYLKKYNKKYYINNRDELLSKQKQYYTDNKEIVLNYQEIYYEKNREKILKSNSKRGKIWRNNNPNYNKEYNINNREKLNILYNKWYHKNKHKLRYIQAWRNILKRTLEYQNINKNNSTFYYLKYSSKELKIRIESQFKLGMSWENYGIIWEIDHKKPVSKFSKNVSPHIVNMLCNLQPLFINENRTKSSKF